MSDTPSDRDETWTGDTDPRPLALYRAGFGALLCAEALGRVPYAPELYSSEGFHRSRFHVPLPSPGVSYVVVLAAALASAAVSLGWRTRAAALTAMALWGWLFAIDQINEKALHSLALVVLALLALSDAGAVGSLDALRARRAGAAPITRVWITPKRLLQLHFAQVYFFAGLGKLFAAGWVTGQVLSLSASSRWATGAGLWVAGWMPETAWRALALLTILYEIVGPWLLFVPWARPWVLALGLSFHLGIQVTLGVGWLGVHFMLALATLYPAPTTWRRVFEAATALRGRAVASDAPPVQTPRA